MATIHETEIPVRAANGKVYEPSVRSDDSPHHSDSISSPDEGNQSISKLPARSFDESGMSYDEADDRMSLDGSGLTPSNPETGSLDKSSLMDRDSLTPSPRNVEDDDYGVSPEDSTESAVSPIMAFGDEQRYVGNHRPANSLSNLSDTSSVLSGGSAQGWLPDVAVVLWRRGIGLLGDINQIEQPEIHAQVMAHICNIIGMLVKIRENQGVSIDGLPNPQLNPKCVPPIYYTLPWLFTSFELSSNFSSGKLAALKSLCNIFVRKYDIPPQPDQFLYFYRCLHRAINCGDERFLAETVRGCSPAFYCHLQ